MDNVPSFVSLSALAEVTSQVASQTAIPPTIILLSGKVYHGLVTLVCVSGPKYGYCCSVFEVLKHIKSVAKEGDRPERYDPLVYFLVATAQGLSPTLSDLGEASVTSIAITNDKLAVH